MSSLCETRTFPQTWGAVIEALNGVFEDTDKFDEMVLDLVDDWLQSIKCCGQTERCRTCACGEGKKHTYYKCVGRLNALVQLILLLGRVASRLDTEEKEQHEDLLYKTEEVFDEFLKHSCTPTRKWRKRYSAVPRVILQILQDTWDSEDPPFSLMTSLKVHFPQVLVAPKLPSDRVLKVLQAMEKITPQQCSATFSEYLEMEEYRERHG